MPSRPVIIGFDGSPAAERALREAAALLAPCPALVVVVWEAGYAFELATLPIRGFEPPPTVVDIRAGFERDQRMYEAAQRMAQHGEEMARQAGLEAESLVVADEITVADTLLRLAREFDSRAIVVGAHGHRAITELLLGSTSQEVIRRAPCPVVVVRGQRRERDG
ncbi:MAG TPA: universal stress protein [Planosporangium sp.]|jgi:nucleotide-binding universal stress UspA family protein|nr:universal stress protein [Planosporangium sp.]